MSSGQIVTVLLVDDHAVVREGYRRLLGNSPSIRVVGEAADAQSAYLAWQEHRPDVTVMDIALPGASGIEALRRIRAREPEARVLMFSMYEDPVFASRALQAGARGYVTKAAAPQVLVEAVLAVAAGKAFIVPSVAQELALRSLAPEGGSAESLSPREFEVLRMLVDGKSVNEIAQSLGLTPKTVANHQSSLRQKLGAGSAVQLLQAAARLGLVPRVPAA
ncbi:MAG: response regulator transcription factor [Pseudomonadota bacterium]|jgi:two-component system invasion response regulator UvrY|nr:MAG: DNA-binding response regulator [Pseudomonadota bacterium]